MKFLLLAFCAIESALALQNGYLSQLNGGSVATSSNNPAPAFMPPQSQQSHYEEISTTTNGAFFPPPTVSMADLYSSAPPKMSNHGGAGAGSGMSSYAPTRNYKPASATASLSSSSFASPNSNPATVPSTEMLTLWSNQVSVELSASQLYLSASIWFRSKGYAGMAAWMLEESGEERGHGLAILEFAMKRNFPVVLQPLDAPRNDWQNPAQVWQDILKAEQTNTQNLLRLAQAASQCGDLGAMAFLDPFHVEQIEAEDKVGAILHKVEQFHNNSPEWMAHLDFELGKQAEEEEHGH